MDSLTRVKHLLDALSLTTMKTLVVALLVAYGGLIFFSGLAGFQSGSYRITEVYQADGVRFACGEASLEVESGTIVTAQRGGEGNYAVLSGDIRMEWPPAMRTWSPTPPPRVHTLRVSLNPADLARMIDGNRDHLQELLTYESDAIRLKEKAHKSFEYGADRLQPLLLPQLEFFRTPPAGTLDLVILDEDLGWTLTAGPMPRVTGWRASVSRHGRLLCHTLVALCSFLVVLLLAAAVLANVARAAGWARSMVKTPSHFAEAPLRNLFAVFVILLTVCAAVPVLCVM